MTRLQRISPWSARLWLAGLIALTPAFAGHAGEVGTGAAPIAPAPVSPVQQPPGPHYEDAQMSVRIVMRTPDQLTAFYLGREFNRAAIAKILDTCFITPIIHNKTLDVLWLELDAWQFSQGDRIIPRIKRDYWPDKWREAGLAQAHQSTFGWTLMPEVRDLRLDEGVGGSVVIPMQSRPFTLTMKFHTGADRQGPVKTVVFENLQCVTNQP
jgi:hypothetical protein